MATERWLTFDAINEDACLQHISDNLAKCTSSMKIQTPEISWHETKPIYSCDLQPFNPPFINRASIDSELRKPLSELPISDISPGDPIKIDPLQTVEKITMSKNPKAEESWTKMTSEDVFGKTWTRLATVGGDNIVRMWRVSLNWEPAAKVLVKTPSKKGQHCPHAKQPGPSSESAVTPVKQGAKKVVAVAQGLVFLANLKRHDSNINVVRWSPTGKFLASGSDDAFITIWKLQEDAKEKPQSKPSDPETDEPVSLETWLPLRFVKGHDFEILDLAWSPDEKAIVSGGVDKKVVLYTLNIPASGDVASLSVDKEVLGSHKHLVQGVAWDPEGVFVASLSNDRSFHVYNVNKKTRVVNVSKVDKVYLFQDDSWRSFFRRMAFSPDGVILVCASGNLEAAQFAGDMGSTAAVPIEPISTTRDKMKTEVVEGGDGKEVEAKEGGEEKENKPEEVAGIPAAPANAPQHAAHIFRSAWSKTPCISLPTGRRPVIAARFCPQPFQLRVTNPEPGVAASSLFDLPYRWIFCLVLDDGILLYDTQQAHPFAQIIDIHYQALNDSSWSSDGRLLTVTSTDGYCSLIYFSEGELGTPYTGPLKSRFDKPSTSTVKGEEQAKPISSTKNDEEKKLAANQGELKPLPKAVEDLNPRRHISFGPEAQEKPHKPIPVTPNAGRFLTQPLPASPCPPPSSLATPSITVRSKATGERRALQLVTLTEDVSKPAEPKGLPKTTGK
nr:chromatin assembly factor 1 subunit b [Hymenolepis microstoma]